MDSTAAVLAILSKLQSLGFCAGLRIPDDAAASDPSGAFDAVLAAFLREAYPGGREARPLPAALGDGGRRVDLLRLFLAVREAGGYAALSFSPIGGGWAAAAESAGLDAALAAPVKLLYAKYLGALDRWIQRLVELHGPFLDGFGRKKQELFIGANGVGKGEAFLDCDEREQQHVMLKRKREDMVGMLDWVREIAENSQDGDAIAAGSADGYFSLALAVREAVIGKRARRRRTMNGTLPQNLFTMACKCCMSATSVRFGAKAKCTEKLQLMAHRLDSDINELTTVVKNMNGSLMVLGQENNLAGQGKHESRMQHNCSDGWLFTSQRNEIPVGPDYQAQVPQWTGELPVNYDDPETLKWLGTKVWPPENENCKALFCSNPIGKGREVVCGCNLPGSVECVRFHVAERRLKLKRELGSAFYAWGFDRMGEEIALSWTDEEEANFKAVAQLNAPSSGRNFWNRLHLLFQLKGRNELVSYYFNCFLLRRRCYQNRITPKNIDSDDEEETEFRFLGNRLGHSAAKYHNTKHTICTENTHCMDLDG
ncbi:AT-rich interactive domain-containing protein 2-like isoform X2 [Phragmites australis]|uniref:AT-rich interactive domain-containing protein 2-like isoform X2 n=1 Tax=Phragmites australis TaxID=29695 RepID=UPI002D79E8B5|nr:AT-rich interactive domain-containing protein 2-like isoform X2 [Phragmites australis]